MRIFMRQNPMLMLIVVGLVGAAFAAPVAAGTAYQWTTDEGTVAFTDDPKRIPGKYKDAATKRDLGKLKTYPRFTVSQKTSEAAYPERVDARLGALRASALPAVSAAPPRGVAGSRVHLDLGIGGRDQIGVRLPTASHEPVVTSSHRVRMRDSIATQDVRITKQGDRIIAVTVSKRNEGRIGERNVPDPGNLFR
jgi:hypothetical protein